MSHLREYLFRQRHAKSCQARLASEAARSLARAGVEKERRPIKAVARKMRRELHLPRDPRLA